MQDAAGWQMLQELLGGFTVRDVATGQQEGNRAAQPVRQGMDFSRASPTRAPNGLLVFPPFPTEAERWAFTADESINT